MDKKFSKRGLLFKICPVHVSKRKVVSIFLALASFFFFYQFIFVMLLSESENSHQGKKHVDIQQPLRASPREHLAVLFDNKGLIRGTKLSDFYKYKPNSNGMFTCFKSRVNITFSFVNDDYCDCPEDGSDEPGTNACDKGKFYCKHQKRRARGTFRDLVIPSSRVNDGICDCCDGSDEWSDFAHPYPIPLKTQQTIGIYQSPCPNVCVG